MEYFRKYGADSHGSVSHHHRSQHSELFLATGLGRSRRIFPGHCQQTTIAQFVSTTTAILLSSSHFHLRQDRRNTPKSRHLSTIPHGIRTFTAKNDSKSLSGSHSHSMVEIFQCQPNGHRLVDKYVQPCLSKRFSYRIAQTPAGIESVRFRSHSGTVCRFSSNPFGHSRVSVATALL